jgi:hypothetical protein
VRCVWIIDRELGRCYDIVAAQARLASSDATNWVAVANILLIIFLVFSVVGIVYGFVSRPAGLLLAIPVALAAVVLGYAIANNAGPDLVTSLVWLGHGGRL